MINTIKYKLTDEYVNVKIKSKIINFCPSNNIHEKKKFYTNLQFLIEERILYRIKIKKEPYNGYNIIHDLEYNFIHEHFNEKKIYMDKQLKELDISSNKYKTVKNEYTKFFTNNNLINFFIDTINSKHNTYKNIYNDLHCDVIVTQNTIKYRDITVNLDDRLKYLLQMNTKEHLMLMILRYFSFGITGHHCAIPINIYKYCVNKLNVKAEGFASPLNSKLIGIKDTIYCTLFNDTDKYYGSVGPFSYKKLVKYCDKNWLINPPYMPNIMYFMYTQIIKAFHRIENDNFT